MVILKESDIIVTGGPSIITILACDLNTSIKLSILSDNTNSVGFLGYFLLLLILN